MIVLWWLVPPLAATLLAMAWAALAGRDRDEITRDDSEAAMRRMGKALARPTPRRGRPVPSAVVEPTHGVALRSKPVRVSSGPSAQR